MKKMDYWSNVYLIINMIEKNIVDIFVVCYVLVRKFLQVWVKNYMICTNAKKPREAVRYGGH